MTNVRNRFAREHGFALPAVLVFALLLSLSAFAGAFLTRTDVQIVTNLQNEKEAFWAAEAGITEVQLRLAMPKPTMLTVDGNTFDASIKPVVDPNWTGTIFFSGTGPVTSGSTFTTPTIQPVADRLTYSTPAASTDALTLRWALDGSGQILKIAGRNVLDIVSTGTSGPARRRVTVQSTQVTGTSIHIHNATACPAFNVKGSVSIRTAGTIQVNSNCPGGAMSVGGSSAVKASVGNVNIVGGVKGSSKAISPTATTSAPAQPDPLAHVQPPCFQNYNPAGGCLDLATLDPAKYGLIAKQMPVRNASEGSPKTLQVTSGTKDLNPGIYYGGILIKGGTARMFPGVYVMAGGGFSVLSNGNATSPSGGVMIYNTQNPGTKTGDGAIRGVTFDTGSATINLSASAVDPYRGLLIFQDRDSLTQPKIFIKGGFSGVIDGVIYGINAPMEMQGGCTLKTEIVVGTLDMQGNAEIQPPPHPMLALGGGGFSPIAWIDY